MTIKRDIANMNPRLLKRIDALDGIATNGGWITDHYIDTGRNEMHSVFTLADWMLDIQWSFKGDFRKTTIVNKTTNARQRMPKEFDNQHAFTWVADLLYDIAGCDA
jgi:hypothetical protein